MQQRQGWPWRPFLAPHHCGPHTSSLLVGTPLIRQNSRAVRRGALSHRPFASFGALFASLFPFPVWDLFGVMSVGRTAGEEMLFTFALISSFAFARRMVRRVPLALPLRELWCDRFARFAKSEEDLQCLRRDYRLPPSTCCGPCLWFPEDVRSPHPSFVIAGSLIVAKASSCPLLPGDPKRR